MPRKSTLINGLVSILAGVLMFSQPALPSSAQTASPLQSPSASPTPAYTPPPTYTPQPTFTPLPPTMTPTLLSPVAAPVNVPPPTLFDPILIIGGGLIILAVLSLIWLRQRRLRRAAAAIERAAQPTEPVKPIAPPPPTAALEFNDTTGGVVRFALTTPSLTLGRSADNDLIVPDNVPEVDTVSQHHAQFRRDQDDYIVRDLNSQNGLTVNGRHTNHNVLQDGDQIAFGAVQAVFHKPTGGAA